MKIKHFAGIFVFLASFTLSVLLVGLPARETRLPEVSFVKEQPARRVNTDLQARILEFLEADRQTGHELSADLSNFRDNTDIYTVEKLATSNLLKKMKSVECKNLPDDFCAAWERQVNAWTEKDKFLLKADRYKNIGAEYLQLEREINRTYYAMLRAAEKYGVYFRY